MYSYDNEEDIIQNEALDGISPRVIKPRIADLSQDDVVTLTTLIVLRLKGSAVLFVLQPHKRRSRQILGQNHLI